MKRAKKTSRLLTLSLSTLCLFGLAGCGGKESEKPIETVPPTVDTDKSNTDEVVKVNEVVLELAKNVAKVGEDITASVKIRPTNATDKDYVLSSSDETVATIASDQTSVHCVAAGKVTITARSKADPTKKSEALLTILGTDEQGRAANLFEAEDANIIPVEGSGMKVEVVSDERVSGTGVVGSLSKGDRIIWGINASEADEHAELNFRLMGPSGWLGYWDSIPYSFADWYTVKVNGKVIDTESIEVEGTKLQGSSADYYAVKDVTIGEIALKAGLNTITFVISNRYDQTTINDDFYSGTLTCFGNIDSMTIYSSKDLAFVPDTIETEGADPDVKYSTTLMEAEDVNTRVYESASNPKVDLTGKTYAEFKAKMNILFGVHTEETLRARISMKVAAPYINETTEMTDVALSDMIVLYVNGKTVDLSGLVIKGNAVTNSKENFSEVTTSWLDLNAGDNEITVYVKENASYAYLGGLDYLNVNYIKGSASAYLVSEPEIPETIRLEAEGALTKRVGYETLAEGATDITLKNATKVQTEKYNNKMETTKIIYGVQAEQACFATLSFRMAAPVASDPTKEVSMGSLGDLWVNGEMVSTPNTMTCDGEFVTLELATQVELRAGKNRIAWEPQNWTDSEFENLGRLDYIEVSSTKTITPYLVNFWTDRNTYFDDANDEPIYVTCDKVNDANPNSCWLGLYRQSDNIEGQNDGSLYWYYPTVGSWNSDQVDHLGDATNILLQNPHSTRDLINGETGGMYVIAYFETDTKNAAGGYDIFDYVTIGVWNDPSVYA